jgi:hypothetical protein
MIAFYEMFPEIRDPIIDAYRARFSSNVHREAVLQALPRHTRPRQDEPWPENVEDLPDPPYPNPEPDIRYGDPQRMANSESDKRELLRRAHNGKLNVWFELPNGHIYYVLLPSFRANNLDYNKTILHIMKTYAPIHPLTDVLRSFYIDAFPDLCTASVCLSTKGWPFFHATTTCVNRGPNNSTLPVGIVEAGIKLDPSKDNVNMGAISLDNIDQETLNLRKELYEEEEKPTEPLPPHLRNHPALTNHHPDKQRCPPREHLQDLMNGAYEHLVAQHASVVIDDDDNLDDDAGNGFVESLEGLIVIMPSSFQDAETLILNGRHFDKRCSIAGVGVQWKKIRNDTPDVDERAEKYLEVARENIIEHIQSPEVVERLDYMDIDYCYASDSFLGSVFFMLRHRGRPNFVSYHHPQQDEELSKSALIQIAANADLLRVRARELEGRHRHILRWRLPIPVFASYHIEWGPASRPIFGATFTIMDEFYRPTLGNGIRKFGFS